MTTIISLAIPPEAKPEENLRHLDVLKDRLPIGTNTQSIAVIAVGEAVSSPVCEAIGEVLNGKRTKPINTYLDDNTSNGLDIFVLFKLRTAILTAYLQNMETIFVVHYLDRASPLPEIFWSEYKGIHKVFEFNRIHLYA